MALYDEAYVATQRARIRELEAELERQMAGAEQLKERYREWMHRAEKAEADVAELEALLHEHYPRLYPRVNPSGDTLGREREDE